MNFGRRSVLAGGVCFAAGISRALWAQGVPSGAPYGPSSPDPDETGLNLEPEVASEYLCGTLDNQVFDELSITDFSSDDGESYGEVVERLRDTLDITDFGTATVATRWQPSDGRTPESGVVTLGCAFLSGTPRQQRTVVYLAERWMTNGLQDLIRFEFGVPVSEAQVRIAIGDFGYLAQVGKVAKRIAPGEPTVTLWRGLERKKVIHEFGHVLGLRHEHQHPDRRGKLDEAAVLDYFGRTQNWSQATTYDAILKTWDEDNRCVGHPDHTVDSIMSYDIPALLTLDGRAVSMASRISPDDLKCLLGLYSHA